MLLVYKNLEYRDKNEPKPSILPMVMCWLWWPTNYSNFIIPTRKCYATRVKTFLTQTILTTFLLKYYNNSQVMADFNSALKDFYKNGLDFTPISNLCKKYGRTISLKYVITAYNICLMFIRSTDFRDNKDFYSNFSRNIKVDKDFVNNATSDIIDVSFDEYVAKYNAKPLLYDKNPNEICKMLDNSLTHAQRFDFIAYNNLTKTTLYDNILNVTSFAKNIFNKKIWITNLILCNIFWECFELLLLRIC